MKADIQRKKQAYLKSIRDHHLNEYFHSRRQEVH